jgi:flagellin
VAYSDLTRVRSNILALLQLGNLRRVNAELATHQLRVGTGIRINSAADDPAGLVAATKLRSRSGVLRALYDNAGQASNLLSTAESALQEIKETVLGLGEKFVAAASDALGDDERQAIVQEVVDSVAAIDEIASQTEFNGMKLLDGEHTLRFQTMPSARTEWTSAAYDTGTLGMSSLAALKPTDTIDGSNYQTYQAEADQALSRVLKGLADVGSKINRIDSMEGVLAAMRDNTEAAYNRIYNADMAEEQIAATTQQILQQTSLTMLTQANLNSRSVLQLFGRD